jgi:glucosamine-6-phosphate deaminase
MERHAELRRLHYGKAEASVCPSRVALGFDAARKAAGIIQRAIEQRGRARIMVATGNSQLDFMKALVEINKIEWPLVDMFHMDEYVGISAQHPASFRLWIKDRLEDKVPLRAIHYIRGNAQDIPAEIARYAALLATAPIDCAFVGFGENGHIAFNDPAAADFQDPVALKVVELDPLCRQQQVGEGHFPDVDSVPRMAITVTCSALFAADAWVCCVPEARKATAVRDALTGPISPLCPASLVRLHPSASVFLDEDSASLLYRP